jgi:hypothetical protein
MSQTALHLADRVIPHVPVRQWVLSLQMPLRVLLAAAMPCWPRRASGPALRQDRADHRDSAAGGVTFE